MRECREGVRELECIISGQQIIIQVLRAPHHLPVSSQQLSQMPRFQQAWAFSPARQTFGPGLPPYIYSGCSLCQEPHSSNATTLVGQEDGDFLFSETSMAYRMPLPGIIWILPSICIHNVIRIICIHNVIRILQSRNFTVQVTCICLAHGRCFMNKLEQFKHSAEMLWKVLKDKRSFEPKDLPPGILGLLDELMSGQF